MSHRLFLLDSMALLYRAHFALIKKPIFTSKGVNTSALYGYANTILDILQNQKPTHLAAAFDTAAPTPRHTLFPAYKAQREEMPEDLSIAIPASKRLLQAMRIPMLEVDGYEADDLIGTMAHQAEERGGFETLMVTPDKDFGQLVTANTKIYKPGRQGNDTEILGVQEICERWGVARPEQVIDLLGLMGDASDNIPGIKGVGEKTAAKLIQQFGSVEAMLANADKIEGKLKDKVKEGAEMATLSKQLATIMRDAPLAVKLDDLAVQSFDDEALKALFAEFEFNALGKRLFGEDFKAGRGTTFAPPRVEAAPARRSPKSGQAEQQGDLFGGFTEVPSPAPQPESSARKSSLETDARESILAHVHDPDLDAGRNAEGAFVAAQSLFGTSTGANYGWGKSSQRTDLEASQLGILRRQAQEFSVPGILIAERGEHRVYHDEAHDLVFKVTHSKRFGYVLDQGRDIAGRRLTLRDALPSEYLWRLALQNVVFGDQIRLVGIRPDSGGFPTFVTCQPFLREAPGSAGGVTVEAVEAFMQGCGFVRVPEGMFSAAMEKGDTWYRVADQILVHDATPDNFVAVSESVLLPVDLVIQHYPARLLAQTASRCDVRWNAPVEAMEVDEETPPPPSLRTAANTPHHYELVQTKEERAKWFAKLAAAPAFCFDTETDGLDPLTARMLGLAFSITAHEACYLHIPEVPEEHLAILAELKPLLTASTAEKIGHNLKFDLRVLLAHGIEVRGPFFDTMLAHALVEPDQRHGMDYLSERYLGYTPISITTLIGEKKAGTPQCSMAEVAIEPLAEYSAEDADVTLQLAHILRAELEKHGQHKVFYDIEAPLLPVLARMEHEGVKVDVAALGEIGATLEMRARELEVRVQAHAAVPFNLNSPRQLGEVLFDQLKLAGKPKKTATGQYQTNEQTLQSLQGMHPIIEEILAYRECTKLKNTYVDALPETVSPVDGRVHTTFHQLMAATGRMASSDPNLQNIPIRSDQGREIRKAFVPERAGWVLLSADYSQIELRVMAALSGDDAMAEAFQRGLDIHLATAARVYRVGLDEVTSDMRRTAKMVNFGIIYGISAFGLSQRLGIPRREAASIIENYFVQYPGVKAYMEGEVADARQRGYVVTLTGRRRYLRDINSGNATVRNATERVAMNTPIQGTAADLIKLAMVKVASLLREGGYQTRMLLQVHDELLFEVPVEELDLVRPLIIDAMEHAIPLRVPVLVETGTGKNWLEAH
ncbi:MAG: DNA polymerase I [Roseimicrobium sp.]